MVSIVEQGRSLPSNTASAAEIGGVIRETPAERRRLAVEISEAPSVVVEKVASAEIHLFFLANTFG